MNDGAEPERSWAGHNRWIAACCLVYDLPIVTNNLDDFKKIEAVESTLAHRASDR